MNLKATTKDKLLKEMVMLLANSGIVRDWEAVLEDVKAREDIMSTGLQRGVAFPHAKSDGVVSTCAAIGVCPEGIDFNALDGEKSRFFVMIVSPRKTSSPHMLLLSSMSFILRDSEVVEELIKANDSEELLKMIRAQAMKVNSKR